MSNLNSAVPRLLDALVTTATTALPDRLVVDGYGVSSGSSGDVLMIGVDDPESVNPASSADTEQTPATMGSDRSRDELGQITCAAMSWAGGTNQKAVRDAAYATFEGLAAAVRATPQLGVTAFSYLTTTVGSNTRLVQNQNDYGVVALVVFRIGFRARL